MKEFDSDQQMSEVDVEFVLTDEEMEMVSGAALSSRAQVGICIIDISHW